MSLGKLALLGSLTGCSMMLAGMTPKPHIVDNPLVSGQPLESSKKGDVGTVGESDCNTWPFEDTTSVQVSAAQICVATKKHVAQPPGWSGEPTADRSKGFQIDADGATGPYINAEKTHAAKVGQCFNKGFNAQIAIWAFEYKGCTPNNGLVSAASKSLRVGDQSWTFAGAPATPTAVTPSAPTASTP